MLNRMFFLLLTLCSISLAYIEAKPQAKVHYPLIDDPIDVVIVCHPKDKVTLDDCIDGIKENCNKVRRVIIVSSERLTDKAEWFDERQFPFDKKSIAWTISRGDKERAEKFFHKGLHRTPGWYFQQLLKLYSPFMIPGISSNVLILDADTIFMNPVEFLNESFGGLFSYSSAEEAKPAYFEHAKRLVPGYKRIYPKVYSVCHHMLFQKPILEDLFLQVEEYHKEPFWKAFCLCVDLRKNKGASEYEIYYNFALNHTDQVALRKLKWANSSDIKSKDQFKERGYHFVAFHTYLRENNPFEKFIAKPTPE
jgi:hypothetical protein